MTSNAEQGMSGRIVPLWWDRLPRLAHKVSPLLAVTLRDGMYLRTWPKVATFAPPIACVLGILAGWLRPASWNVYTYSLPLLAAMIAIAFASTGVGTWLWLGFSLSDLLLFKHDDRTSGIVERVALLYLPLLISYVLLAILLLYLPMASQSIARSTLGPKRGKLVHASAVAILQALLAAVMVWSWTQSIALLIRPVYTWQAWVPTVEAIQPVQQDGWVLALVAAIVTCGRGILEQRFARRIQAFQQAEQARPGNELRIRRLLPRWLVGVLKIAGVSLLFSGMLMTWQDALLFVGFQILVLVVRDIALVRVPRWADVIGKVPLLVRLGIGVLASYGISLMIISTVWYVEFESFRTLIISGGISALLYTLLVPPQKNITVLAPHVGQVSS